MKISKKSWAKIIGVCVMFSVFFGFIGGIITNEYVVAYLFSTFVEEQEERSPIVKKVIEERTFVEESGVTQTIEDVSSSLVTLNSSNNQYTGTGLLLTTDGLIASCGSIVGKQSSLKVSDYEGNIFNAKVAYRDNNSDIVFLKVLSEGNLFQTIDFDEPKELPGETVLNLGRDDNGNLRVKKGIVSSYAGKNSKYTILDYGVSQTMHCTPTVNLGGKLVGIALTSDFESVEFGTSHVMPVTTIDAALIKYQALDQK